MHQPSSAPTPHPQLRYPEPMPIGLQIAIQRANAFFQASIDIHLNDSDELTLNGKWPSDLEKVSNHCATEFGIVVNKNRGIRRIEEKSLNKSAEIEIHALSHRSLTFLLNSWTDEQITKSSPSLFENQPVNL